MCKEEQELLFFSPYYIRFDNHKNILNLNANLKSREPLNYPNTTVQMSFRDLAEEELNNIRFSWSFLKFFNDIL